MLRQKSPYFLIGPRYSVLHGWLSVVVDECKIKAWKVSWVPRLIKHGILFKRHGHHFGMFFYVIVGNNTRIVQCISLITRQFDRLLEISLK